MIDPSKMCVALLTFSPFLYRLQLARFAHANYPSPRQKIDSRLEKNATLLEIVSITNLVGAVLNNLA